MEYVADAVPVTKHRHISKNFQQWRIDLHWLVAKFRFVHGDLHDVNLLSGDDGRVKLVDFDWGGRDREVLYPTPRLNVDGQSSEGLRITKADAFANLDQYIGKDMGTNLTLIGFFLCVFS